MERLFTTLLAVVAVGLFAGGLRADDKDKDDKTVRIKITEMNKDGTFKAKIKTPDGKEEERTFKPAAAVRYLDSNGKVAAADIFHAGDYALIVEREGVITQMQRDKDQTARGGDGR